MVSLHPLTVFVIIQVYVPNALIEMELWFTADIIDPGAPDQENVIAEGLVVIVGLIATVVRGQITPTLPPVAPTWLSNATAYIAEVEHPLVAEIETAVWVPPEVVLNCVPGKAPLTGGYHVYDGTKAMATVGIIIGTNITSKLIQLITEFVNALILKVGSRISCNNCNVNEFLHWLLLQQFLISLLLVY